MMRARNLGALAGHTPAQASGSTTVTAPTAAEVVLHFEVVPLLQQASGLGASSGAGEGAAAASDAKPARLLVRRRVTRGGRTESAVCRLPPGHGGVAAGAQWQGVAPPALRELLAPWGIQTEAVDR